MAQQGDVSDELVHLTEATLALAYEQRTATLLHLYEIALRAQSAAEWVDVEREIRERLGLGVDRE